MNFNLQASFTAQEDERNRIAISLHDEIGASLTTIKINLETLYKKLENTRGVNLLFNELFTLIAETIKRSREIVRDISPATLKQFGITHAIDQLCRSVNHSFVIKAKLEITGTTIRLSEERELLVYRTAQELINNALKYSNAWQVFVSLNWLVNVLELEIRDNGLGVQDYRPIGSTGITNIENRVKLLGGTVNQEMAYGGTHFKITIPYELNG
jgi:two-component system, NarL family, sensor kinase